MITIENLKKYLNISSSDTADDSLLLGTILPSSILKIGEMLGIAKTAKVKSTGSVQIQRENDNNEVINIDQSITSFFSPEGLQYRPVSQDVLTIQADKAEQNIQCVAFENGPQYDSTPGKVFTSVPSIQKVTIQSLGFAGGLLEYQLPDSQKIDLAVYYLATFYYENRSFLAKKDLKMAVMNQIIGLLNADRSNEKFIPEGMSNAI